MKDRTCCLTGHREIPPEGIPVITKALEDLLTFYIEQGYIYFGTGGAVGFDTIAAKTVLRLKQQYPEIKLILVLPCKEQTLYWSQHEIAEYEHIKQSADKIIYTSEHYYNGCMQKRNRHLVDNSSLCICYLTKPYGGTAYTVKYAQKRKLRVCNVFTYINL